MKKVRFGFEDLEVWQKAVDFQFLYIARGSLYETITLLIIFHKKKWINDSELEEIKNFGAEIGKMLSSLIKSIKNSMN